MKREKFSWWRSGPSHERNFFTGKFIPNLSFSLSLSPFLTDCHNLCTGPKAVYCIYLFLCSVVGCKLSWLGRIVVTWRRRRRRQGHGSVAITSRQPFIMGAVPFWIQAQTKGKPCQGTKTISSGHLHIPIFVRTQPIEHSLVSGSTTMTPTVWMEAATESISKRYLEPISCLLPMYCLVIIRDENNHISGMIQVVWKHLLNCVHLFESRWLPSLELVDPFAVACWINWVLLRT